MFVSVNSFFQKNPDKIEKARLAGRTREKISSGMIYRLSFYRWTKMSGGKHQVTTLIVIYAIALQEDIKS